MPGAVTLSSLLQARTSGLSEPEIWSLLCQSAQALQDLFLAKRVCHAPRVSPACLRLTSLGRVSLVQDQATSEPWPTAANPEDRYLAPEYTDHFRNSSEVDIEKMWIFSLGRALQEAVDLDRVTLTRPLDKLLTVMTRVDPRQRASLMDVLNVISDFCKVRLDCKPFSHVAMDLYRETLDSWRGEPPCLPVTAVSPLVKPVSKSCSLNELQPPRRPGLRRAPTHQYGVSGGKYTGPNTLIGPEFVILASQPGLVVRFNTKASLERKVTVILLDGRRVVVHCDPTSVTAGRVFEVVVQLERLEENFFLGLTVLLDGDLFFLCPDTRLSKLTSLTLYLRVRFFLPSLRGVGKWASKHLLYLQLRRSLLEGQLRCEAAELEDLGGLALQAEFGDHPEGAGDYFMLEHYVPEGRLEAALGAALRAQHRRRRGLDPGRAEEMFVALAQSLDAYGLHVYAATRVRKNASRSAMWVALGAHGILLYDRRGDTRDLHKLYAWNNIDKLCYTKQYFVLYPRCDVQGIIPVKYKFQLDQNKCLFVFYLASQHHQFFLKLRNELSSLQSLSRKFGVSLASLVNRNRKLFHVEEPLQAPTSCLCPDIEENQNKENEQPGHRRLSQGTEQHTQCLPCFLQYPGGSDDVRRSGFPRRHRVKMGTRAISSAPKELSASQDTAETYVPISSAPKELSSEAYVLDSSIKSTNRFVSK